MRAHPVLAVLVGSGTAPYQALYFFSVLLVGVSGATVVSLGLAPILAAIWVCLTARTRPPWREVGVLTA
jgi:drug/metabolite transporter, DME family